MRNLGATFGVALVLAFVADITPDTALDSFHRAWWVLIVSGLAVTATALRLPIRRPNPATAPSTAAVVEVS